MGKYLRGVIWLAVILGLVGAAARAVLFDVWVVPEDPKISASVAPTLMGGDTVLYLKRNKPSFGDLVRCTDPDDVTRFVVGRVAGLRGDTVETNGADLHINNKRYTSEMGCSEPRVTIPHPTSGSPVEINCDQVSMGGHPHYRGISTKAGIYVPTKTDVGDGMVFLLSDDRSYHDDSRDFGTVRADTCTGRIVFRLVGKEGWSNEKARFSFIQ